MKAWPYTFASKKPVDELAEFRLDLEGVLARKAAQKTDIKDIERLKKLLVKAKSLLKDPEADFQDYIRLDRGFHLALTVASHNQMYEFLLRVVHENMSDYFEKHLD